MTRDRAWLAAAVVIAAAFSFVVLLLPARGLTFLHDDWAILSRCATTGWPTRDLIPHNEHWIPLWCALVDLERALFGMNHTGFLAVTWLVHVANVALLARFLAVVTRDARAAAAGAVAFGTGTAWRDVLWWVNCSGIALAFGVALVALLVIERMREDGRLRWVALVAVLSFAGPCCHGFALAVGPGLATAALLLLPRGRRAVPALAAVAAVAAYLAVRSAFATRSGDALPSDPRSAWLALRFAVVSVGLGALHSSFLVPASVTAGAGAALAAVYAVLLGGAALAGDGEQRRRLAVVHVLWLGTIVPAALVRWSFPLEAAVFSRYLYIPWLAWSLVIAVFLAAVARRYPRALLAAVPVLALLALGHAVAARDDRRLSAPEMRRDHPAFVAQLVARTTAARGPVYDPLIPSGFAGFMQLHVHDVVGPAAPDARVVWTRERTPDSIEPYRGDPFLRPLAWSPP